MTNERKCSERITEQWASRRESFEALASRISSVDTEESEEAQDELYEFPLAVTSYRMVRIDLSTGGPGDWLEVVMGDDQSAAGDVQRIEYHFNDWFDHASVTLDGDDFEAARDFAENFIVEAQ